ncbi:hypothetical protein LCGC14_0450870 [marine sediment metagenome]|uniref:Uncharacterized protein n=1 Tax=marine sediment metagenome TaxID=412755 RepID=A0A0F9V4K0_9ZZZZ
MADEVVNQELPEGSPATQVVPGDGQPENNQATAVPTEEGVPPPPVETTITEPEPSSEQAAGIRLKGERDAAVEEAKETKAKLAFLEQERVAERAARPSQRETKEEKQARFQSEGHSYVDTAIEVLEDKFSSRREWDKLMSAPASRKDPQYEARIKEIVKKYDLGTGNHARDAYFAYLEYDKKFGAQLPRDPASTVEKTALGGAPAGGGTPGQPKSKRDQARELYTSGKISEALKMHKEAKKEEEQE